MIRVIFMLVVGLGLFQDANAQSIKGTITTHKNNQIVLNGFFGLEKKELTKTQTDSLGNFELKYPKSYVGVGVLQLEDGKNGIILLNQENGNLNWENTNEMATLKITNSPENEFFHKGTQVFQESEQKLAGLRYLAPLYFNNKKIQEMITTETASNELAFQNYINQLPTSSYAKSYLNLRKLIAQIAQTTKQNPEQFSKLESEFNAIKWELPNTIHSGLYNELLGGYFSLLETNLQNPATLKAAEDQMKSGIAVLVSSLATNPTLQEEVAQYLFKNFEKRNLEVPAEFLALQMLNQSNCQLSSKSIQLFEQYRKLAIGNNAPDIDFGNGKLLSLDKNNYKLVVFGESTCPNCQTDYPSLIGKYKLLKEKYNFEVYYISLDTDKTAFETYYKESPFPTYCDYKGWGTTAAKNYFIHATPTYILLDQKLKIVMKIKSPEHLQYWFENN
jgi:thioredoxin-related protein